MENNAEGNGWPEYRREVMASLHQLREDVKQLDGKVDDVRLDVAGLKIRASAWGALAGMIPAAIAIIWHYLSGRTKP